ncbi:MAG: metallophosphoesterase [candidate division KSB1 bacterium]|nr:metallophosphoesterase [candidate division KSB1 bacterium]MDZ7301918.1 metallophosphoesterase [candidate division KSB1 bacterium]MDZ7314251.1 metallophosphoesterase [candidate division KSB1 bacterium]
MAFFLFFLIAFTILALGYGYIGWRLIIPANLDSPWNVIAWAILILFLLIPISTFILQVNRVETTWTHILSWISYVSMGFVSFLFTSLVIRDLIWLITAGAQKIFALAREFFSSPVQAVAPDNPERRRFLMQTMNLGILGVSGVLTGYGVYEARRRPAIVEITVPIANLPEALEGFRILQITDIHAGLTVRRKFVETIVAQANELAPDLIAFTGDLVDGSVPHLRDEVAPMAELSARYGRYFITGNHEYYSGAEPWVEEADRLGFTVLLNEHRILQLGSARMLLAGVTDYSAGQFLKSHISNPEAAISGAPPCEVKILLAHQPRSLYAALPLGFDLQISGHTHGGQFFPWNLLAAAGQPYIAGLHQREKTWIYVSKGTGYWGPPIRLGARSEITILKLTKTRPVSS